MVNNFEKIIDSVTPKGCCLSGKYKKSFAYTTFSARVPKILDSCLAGLEEDKKTIIKERGEKAVEDLEKVKQSILQLKCDINDNKTLELFIGNEPDTEAWNDFLNQLPADQKSYYNACWLYSECYMYRRLSSFFKATNTLQNFDYFASQKENALRICDEVLITVGDATRNTEKSEEVFSKLVRMDLWGNRFDLSLSAGKEVQLNKNPMDTLDEFDEYLLINNCSDIWKALNNKNASTQIVDIICDNAAYELFSDFILAEYIIDKGLACKVRFNVKAVPWFISDVIPKDIHWVLKYLKDHEKSETLQKMGAKWCDFLSQGKFELAPEEFFWTSPYEFYRMSCVNPSLHNRLSEAQLLIFKGDLNYRKLLGDRNWDYTEDFNTCLRGFRPTNLCTLRTVKADLICGLTCEKIEELFKSKPDWMITGEFGVIQFAPKNTQGNDEC